MKQPLAVGSDDDRPIRELEAEGAEREPALGAVDGLLDQRAQVEGRRVERELAVLGETCLSRSSTLGLLPAPNRRSTSATSKRRALELLQGF